MLLFLLLLLLRSICNQVENEADKFVLQTIISSFSQRFARLFK